MGAVRLVVVRSVVTGKLRLADGGSPAGAVVTLVPSDKSMPSFPTIAGPGGEYRIIDVPEGEYVVRASHLEYAPEYSDEQAVEGEGQTRFADLTLQPASAVVRVEVDGVIGAKYSRFPAIQLLMLAFGDHVRLMKLSEDPAFKDPSKGDVDWRQYAASVEATLSPDDGEKTLYAQFRDSWEMDSPVFSTRVVLDRTPPVIDRAVLGDGSGWVRALAAQTPLSIEATDALSGVASFVVSTDGVIDSEAPELRQPAPGTAVIATSVDVGTMPGSKTILVRVSDAAGNVSETKEVRVVVDATAPTTGTPAVRVNAGATTVHSRDVLLTFDVVGDDPEEPLFYAVENASGVSVAGPFFLLRSAPVPWVLAEGDDGLRTVCARFSDAAGNTTDESCVDVTLDRTGGISGSVLLEEIDTTLAGVTATVTSDVDPSFTRVATTDDNGNFVVGNLPLGTAYVVRLSLAGYEGAVIRPVSVFSGQTITLDTERLRRARGSVSGMATLNDRLPGESGGIVIAAANSPYAVTTTPTGAFLLRDLPVGSYEIVARAQGYLAASFGTVTVRAGQEQALGAIQLRRQSGSFAVCRADDTQCAQGSLSFTGSRDVLLNLTSTTATQYRAGSSEDLSAHDYQPLEEGRTTYPFTLLDADGEQTIFVQ